MRSQYAAQANGKVYVFNRANLQSWIAQQQRETQQVERLNAARAGVVSKQEAIQAQYTQLAGLIATLEGQIAVITTQISQLSSQFDKDLDKGRVVSAIFDGLNESQLINQREALIRQKQALENNRVVLQYNAYTLEINNLDDKIRPLEASLQLLARLIPNAETLEKFSELEASYLKIKSGLDHILTDPSFPKIIAQTDDRINALKKAKAAVLELQIPKSQAENNLALQPKPLARQEIYWHLYDMPIDESLTDEEEACAHFSLKTHEHENNLRKIDEFVIATYATLADIYDNDKFNAENKKIEAELEKKEPNIRTLKSPLTKIQDALNLFSVSVLSLPKFDEHQMNLNAVKPVIDEMSEIIKKGTPKIRSELTQSIIGKGRFKLDQLQEMYDSAKADLDRLNEIYNERLPKEIEAREKTYAQHLAAVEQLKTSRVKKPTADSMRLMSSPTPSALRSRQDPLQRSPTPLQGRAQ